MRVQISRLKQAFDSVLREFDGDEESIHEEHGGPCDPELLGQVDGNGQPFVKVYRGKTASCQAGKFLVRTSAANLTKADHFVFVPYVAADPMQVDEAVGRESSCGMDVDDEAEDSTDDNVSEGTAQDAAAERAAVDGVNAGDTGDVPEAYLTVLKVTDLYAWHQRTMQGGNRVTRFAVGTMQQLESAGRREHGYELDYTDSITGGRERIPSLMRVVPARKGGRSYKYAVRLDQMRCTLVTTNNENVFLPSLKTAGYG